MMKKTGLKLCFLAVTAVMLCFAPGCSSDKTAVDAGISANSDENQGSQDVSTYTVGGQLEGLVDGDTVVLQVNGAADLSLDAGGSFVFEKDFNDGDNYEVTVATQPDHCDCTIEDGSGTVDGDNVTSVKVRCRRWFHPADLDDNISPDGTGAQKPQVAVDGQGNAIVVWRQAYVSGRYRIYKAECRNGNWSMPGDVSDTITPYAYQTDNCQVAMNAKGDAVIVWQQYDNGRWQIFKAEYRDGVWSDFNYPERLSLPGQNAYYPQVAMDGQGNTIVVWQQYDGASSNLYHIYKAEYRNGAWSRPSDFDNDAISPDGKHAYYPHVAMDDGGNAIIVWQQQDDINRWQIFKAEYRNGAWTKPSDLADNISPDNINAYSPRTAMDCNGNALIVWEQLVSSLRQVVMLEYRNGAWSDFNYPEPLSQFGRNEPYRPQVAMGAEGEALVVWRQWDGANRRIFKAEYRDGVWAKPAGLSDNISPPGTDVEDPRVAMGGGEDAVITWRQQNGSGTWQVYKSEFRLGAWEHPVDLATDNISRPGGHVQSPAIAMNADGDTVIAWQQSDGGNEQIFRSEYR